MFHVEHLEVAAPVNRARVRAAVIAYMKRYASEPPLGTRASLMFQYGDDAVDGFDEGVDFGRMFLR